MSKKFLMPLLILASCSFVLASCGEKPTSEQSQNISQETSHQTSQNTSQEVSNDCNSDVYTVTFYMNDGTNKVVETQQVKNGEKATRPTNVTREGYINRGWGIDEECLVLFNVLSNPITANLDLYARWVVDANYNPEGETSSEQNPQQGITYTITDMPDWVQNDGCIIFAWAWPEGGPGAWYELTYTSKTEATFTVDQEMAGVTLARAKGGSTINTVSWNVKGDADGRIYNKTGDIKFTAGTYTYKVASWVEYGGGN